MVDGHSGLGGPWRRLLNDPTRSSRTAAPTFRPWTGHPSSSAIERNSPAHGPQHHSHLSRSADRSLELPEPVRGLGMTSARFTPSGSPVRPPVLRARSPADDQVGDSSGWSSSEEDARQTKVEEAQQAEMPRKLLKKASAIIESMDEPWKSGYREQISGIKTVLKEEARRIENCLLNDSILAQALSKQLALNTAAEEELVKRLAEIFGDALEEAVKLQSTVGELQERLKSKDQELRDAREAFLETLTEMKSSHLEEVQTLRNHLVDRVKTLRAKVQSTKSGKTEQRDMQRHLARYLEEGLG